MADLAKAQAAEELGVSERTIDRLRACGELAWHKVGSDVRIEPASLEDYRRRRREAALAEARMRGWADFSEPEVEDERAALLRRALNA